MKRFTAGIAVLAMAGSATAQEAPARGRSGPPEGQQAPGAAGRGYANPSALIAAEIALHQLAREKGLWKAYRENAATGAELLTPEPTLAEPWLKDRQDPAALPDWEPYAVWMSCDGSYGAIEGGWSEPGSSGLYASLWQRQADGSYKWLIRQRIGPDRAIAAPDMLSAIAADCAPRKPKTPGDGPPPDRKRPAHKREQQPVPPVNTMADYSADRTFYWRSGKDADGTPWLLVAIRKNGEMRKVLGEALGSLPGE